MSKRQKVTPEMIDTMAYLAGYGHSQGFIARAVGLNVNYLSDLKKSNSDVRDAFNVSTKGLIADIKANMHRIAIDGDDKYSINVGMKLLDKYDVDAVSAVDVSVTVDVKSEILKELQ